MRKMLLTIILLVVFFPLNVLAKVDDVEYDVEAMYVDATVSYDGSMEVKELIILDGSFNGFERNLLESNDKLISNEINFEHSAIYNPGKIKVTNVSAVRLSNYDFADVYDSYDEYNQTSNDKIGSTGYFNYYLKNDDHVIRTYNSCSNCTVGFYYEYYVEDVVVMHNDIAEIYYQFIGDAFRDKIEYLDIRLNLPDKDDEIRVWAHGSLNGEIYKNDDNDGVIATIENLKKGNPVDIRMTFNKNLILFSDTLDHTNVDALDEILKVEKLRAEEANRQREIIRKRYEQIQLLALVYVLIMIIYFVYLYIRYDREYKSDFDHKYNREFIDDYDVEVVDYLLNKMITSNAMSASIMNLVYKKKISVTEVGKKNYSFTLLSRDGLSDAESSLVDFLFNNIGDGKEFTINQLKSYAKSTKTCTEFTSSYESWKNKVQTQAKKENFWEDNVPAKILAGFYALLGFGVFIYSVASIEDFAMSHLVIIPSFIFLIYVIAFRKKTLKGINHYKRWNAFKNFLNDFGTFETKELPEIALWERYLVYAVIFGLANKVQKDMNVKINEINAMSGSTLSTSDIYVYSHMNLSNSINTSVASAVNSAVSTAVATSTAASSSGSGGGFSSGGGFGGGGGGGGGF